MRCAAGRVVECQPPGMQKHARKANAGSPSPRATLPVQLEVAVLVVADDGVPGVRQVHADLVGAPGLDVDRRAACRPRSARATLTRVIERRPSSSSALHRAHPALAVGRSGLVQRHVDHLLVRRPGADRPARRRSCRCRAARNWSCSAVSALRFLASSKTPEVSLVQPMHQFEELAQPGRALRSCSITPKLTPLPPCTATPAGLSSASSCSSS